MMIKRSMAEGAQGWLRVPGSAQAWPMCIFRALPTDSGEGGGFTPDPKMV